MSSHLPDVGLPRVPLLPPAQPEARRAEAPRLELRWARHGDELQAAQRLRRRVFDHELGVAWAAVSSDGSPARPTADDDLDLHAEHLLLCCAEGPNTPARVVGTCRLLTAPVARRLGRWQGSSGFDLSPLDVLGDDLVEFGQACIAPAYRRPAAITTLLGGVFDFLRRHPARHLLGYAALATHDGGLHAASLCHALGPERWAPPAWRVRPHFPMPVGGCGQRESAPVEVWTPPMLRGCLLYGARVLGPLGLDTESGAAQLPLLFQQADLPAAFRSLMLPDAA